MIRVPTTFVVGAGASQPYGVTTGPGLKRKAVQLGLNTELYGFVRVVMARRNIETARLNEFHMRLQQFPEDSIDAFLEKNNTEPMATTGKIVLAALIGRELLRAKIEPPTGQDWLLHVVQRLVRNADSYGDFVEGNATIRFVTFNFDTFIERRIAELLRWTYPIVGYSSTDNLSVIHVHGSVPSLPNNRIAMDFDVLMPDMAWVEWIDKAATQINVTSDKIEESVLKNAQLAIEQASVVSFLGFSYNQTNLERIGIPKTIRNAKQVYGSAFGLSPSDRITVTESFNNNIELAPNDLDCLKSLTQVHVIKEVGPRKEASVTSGISAD